MNHALEYLSPANRDDVECGCTFAATGSELVRADEKTRHVASEAFKRVLDGLAPFMRTSQSDDRTSAAISVLTNMIGALIMSRMVDDPLLSDRILEVTRERLTVSVMGDYPKVGLKRTLLQRRNTLKDRICLALRFREGGFFLHTPSENSGILEGLVRRQNRLVDADR